MPVGALAECSCWWGGPDGAWLEKENEHAMPAQVQHFARPEQQMSGLTAHGSSLRAWRRSDRCYVKKNYSSYLLLHDFATTQHALRHAPYFHKLPANARTAKKKPRRMRARASCTIMAEGEGFEPPEGSHLQRFSRPPRSTALPPLHRVGTSVPALLVMYSGRKLNTRGCKYATVR